MNNTYSGASVPAGQGIQTLDNVLFCVPGWHTVQLVAPYVIDQIINCTVEKLNSHPLVFCFIL